MKEAISRLFRYKSVLEKMRSLGMVKVFSDNLADSLGISAALVRKDFSLFGISGHKRGGYRIEDLLEKLNRILGKEGVQKVVIVGCGKIGTALMDYRGFDAQHIRIVAGFDTNPAKVNPSARLPIYPMDEFARVVREEGVQVAILATPENVAAQVADAMMAAGIRGILNFAPVPLKGGAGCVVHNINIALELENLFYYVRMNAPGSAPEQTDEA